MTDASNDSLPGGREPEDSSTFADQASRCRRLARGTHDRSASQLLEQMANDYERRARGLGT